MANQSSIQSLISSDQSLRVEQGIKLEKKVREDPAWYFTQLLGISPWGLQIEIVESLLENEKTIVPSCVSSGKSFIAGATIAWWLTAFIPSRVFTIAPTERQLKINIWGEFAKIYYGSRMPLGGELLTLNWKIRDNWYAKGFSPKDALGVFGIHGPHDLFIFDDAQGIALDVFDAFENASAAGTARYLFLCNPAVVSGYIYDAIMGRKKMHRITIDAFSTPNVKEKRVVIPGLITHDRVQEWIDEYGWDSDFVRVKVRALPPKQEPDTLIPIDWTELAKARIYELKGRPEAIIGVDVGRFGDDKSVIVVRQERRIVAIISLHGNDTMQVAGRVMDVADEYDRHDIFVDEVGVGGGVIDRIKEGRNVNGEKKVYNVHGINVGTKPDNDQKFVIRRDEMWWAARESLDPTNPAAICLPEDCDELVADLTAMKWSIQSDKKIVVEKKAFTKERIGRSTDFGDAYCLAVFRDYSSAGKPRAVFVNTYGLPGRPSWL